MYFSDAYPMVGSGDWFDPLMEIDTQLFVDPFLIYSEGSGQWATASDVIADYFQRAFELLAGHQQNPSSLQYKKTVDLMIFPEPKEFGLGFVARGTGGSGTGRGFARRMVSAMSLAINVGLTNPMHFEELGLLVDRIGRDRISDIACNILKPMFINYTQDICARHGVPMQSLLLDHARFDELRKRWVKYEVPLPRNPVTGGPILLTPRRFLRELPSLNADNWWEYAEPGLRDDLNLDINQKLKKPEIIALARQHPELVRAWTETRAEEMDAVPYDVVADPEGLHSWQALTRDVATQVPLGFVSPPGKVKRKDLPDFVKQINEHFKLFVEEQGGWRLLWNDDTKSPKREVSIQLLYKGVVQSYCRAYGVALDREVELGRGPVDFLISTSSRSRVLLEIKKMQNGTYWDGLESQLVSYMKSDQCKRGWFLAVRFGDTKVQLERTARLKKRTRDAAKATGFDLRSSWVDARWKKSASELRQGEEGSLPAPGDDDEF